MAKQNAGIHVLPAWFEWFQDNVVLSLLVIAGMILNGLMFTQGLAPHIDNPLTWENVLSLIIFGAFFAAGSGIAGVALRASATMGGAFRAGEWGTAISNLLVSLLFLGIEIWAGVTERSLSRVLTPADRWVLQMIGQPNLPISPTIIAIAFASPFILFCWGIVTRKPEIESAEEQAERFARAEALAAHNAKIAQYQGAGWGARIGAGIKAVKSQVSGDDTSRLDGGIPTGSDDENHGVTGGDTAGYDTSAGQNGYGTKAPVSIKRGQWTSRQLKDYASTTYGVEVSDIEAANTMKVLSKGRKSGAAYVASSRVVKAWVDDRYSVGNADAEPTGTGER